MSGNWREEHLFNLRSALELYDAVQAQVDSYEQKLQEELGRQACEELVGQGCPRHPNPAKEKAWLATITLAGGQDHRSVAALACCRLPNSALLRGKIRHRAAILPWRGIPFRLAECNAGGYPKLAQCFRRERDPGA